MNAINVEIERIAEDVICREFETRIENYLWTRFGISSFDLEELIKEKFPEKFV